MSDQVVNRVIDLRNNQKLTDALVVAFQGLEENSSDVALRLLLVRTLWDLGIFSVARSQCALLKRLAPEDVSIARLAERLGAQESFKEEEDETVAETEFID